MSRSTEALANLHVLILSYPEFPQALSSYIGMTADCVGRVLNHPKNERVYKNVDG